jgi:hypothetical protein
LSFQPAAEALAMHEDDSFPGSHTRIEGVPEDDHRLDEGDARLGHEVLL